MLNEKIPITPSGYQKLTQELHILKSVERPDIIRAIAEARAHGDLSENAEYSSARERQSFIEAKISDLESRMARAEVIKNDSVKGDQVKFGATVTLVAEDDGREVKYGIVGEYESDISSGLVSISSPLARALLGKCVGDQVEVITPSAVKYYELKSICYDLLDDK